MALYVPNEGEVALLDLLVNGTFAADVELGLYQNNLTVDENTVLGDYTEADFDGYTSQSPSFGSATIVSNKGVIEAGSAAYFVHDGGATANTIYGYYVWDSGAGKILWSEALTTPQVMANNGDTLSVTLRLTLSTE